MHAISAICDRQSCCHPSHTTSNYQSIGAESVFLLMNWFCCNHPSNGYTHHFGCLLIEEIALPAMDTAALFSQINQLKQIWIQAYLSYRLLEQRLMGSVAASGNHDAIQIREAKAEDAETIVAFNCRLARETEDRELELGPARHGVERALRRTDMCRYFIAEVEGRVVGQAMITYEWSDWRDGVFWWFQSVYVVPEARRRGVFRRLYRHIEALAREDRDVCGLRLYVEEENHRAMATYRKLGMGRSGHVVYEAEWSDPGT